MTRPIRVRLCTDNDNLRTRWATALSSSPRFEVLSRDTAQPAEMPATPPDVIVTDRLPLTDIEPTWLAMVHRGAIGTIAVGCKGMADVLLPPDHSARELKLACQLLAQIVRLRARSARKHAEQQLLRQMAYSDPLTGLANRRQWDAQLQHRIHQLQRAGKDCCLALLDIDHFKLVNDRHGHAVGDQLLRAAGKQLVESCRRQDLVVRLGGDEFALLLADVKPASAGRSVDRIRAGIAAARVDSAPDLHVTASAGYHVLSADCPNDATSASDAADRALRQAKAAGRNQTMASDAG